jgi:hypothetical protein
MYDILFVTIDSILECIVRYDRFSVSCDILLDTIDGLADRFSTVAPGEEEARQLRQQREGEVAALRAKSDQIKALRAKLQAVRAGPAHAQPSKLSATFE